MVRVLASAIVCVGFVTAAFAAPMGPSHVQVDYTGSGLVIIDVFGSAGAPAGSNVAGSQWDPLMLTSVRGQIQNMLAFGGDTADTGDDFTRYWVSTGPTTSQRWTMSTPSASFVPPSQAQVPEGLPVPEPGSLVLLGSGLLGLASSARRFWRR